MAFEKKKNNDLNFQLHPKQGLLYKSKAKCILFGGAAGGGKSMAMRILSIIYSLNIDGLQTYLFRRSYPDLIKNHVEGPKGYYSLLQPLIDSGVCKINLSRMEIAFSNGSKIFLCHIQHDADMYKYQGSEIHLLLIDELTHFTEDMFRFLRTRVRMVGISVPDEYKEQFPRIICASNPGGPGHSWCKSTFVDAAEHGQVFQAAPEDGGMTMQYIPSKIQDNPSLLEEDPTYIDRLKGSGTPEMVAAFLEGSWELGIHGLAVNDLWSRKNHVLPTFVIPDSWKVFRSFDWGSSAPFSVGWSAITTEEPAIVGGELRHFSPKTVIRIAEYYGWNGKKANEGLRWTASEIADEIKRCEESFKFKVHSGPADNSIFDFVNGQCIAQDMMRKGVHFCRSDKKPGSRKLRLEKMRQRLKASLKHPMEEPGFFVMEHCKQFLRTVPTIPLDPKTNTDVDTNSEDHIWDEQTYMILHAHNEGSVTYGHFF